MTAYTGKPDYPEGRLFDGSRRSSPKEYAETYFGFMEALEQLFSRPVDLVTAASIRNPFLIPRDSMTAVMTKRAQQR